MLFNIWKTWWLSAQILPRGCWAWERNRVAVRLTGGSLSVANTLFIRLSVCLFIWLSNYPSQQTAHYELKVNNTEQLDHVTTLVGFLFGQVDHFLKGTCSVEVENWFLENIFSFFCDVALIYLEEDLHDRFYFLFFSLYIYSIRYTPTKYAHSFSTILLFLVLVSPEHYEPVCLPVSLKPHHTSNYTG